MEIYKLNVDKNLDKQTKEKKNHATRIINIRML